MLDTSQSNIVFTLSSNGFKSDMLAATFSTCCKTLNKFAPIIAATVGIFKPPLNNSLIKAGY